LGIENYVTILIIITIRRRRIVMSSPRNCVIYLDLFASLITTTVYNKSSTVIHFLDASQGTLYLPPSGAGLPSNIMGSVADTRSLGFK
jgi:hypothetical protein